MGLKNTIYKYIDNKEKFEEECSLFEKEITQEYPKSYPCIMKKRASSNSTGIYYTFKIIYDMSDFIYQNDRLYKGC